MQHVRLHAWGRKKMNNQSLERCLAFVACLSVSFRLFVLFPSGDATRRKRKRNRKKKKGDFTPSLGDQCIPLLEAGQSKNIIY
jgi:hypothetical protein